MGPTNMHNYVSSFVHNKAFDHQITGFADLSTLGISQLTGMRVKKTESWASKEWRQISSSCYNRLFFYYQYVVFFKCPEGETSQTPHFCQNDLSLKDSKPKLPRNSHFRQRISPWQHCCVTLVRGCGEGRKGRGSSDNAGLHIVTIVSDGSAQPLGSMYELGSVSGDDTDYDTIIRKIPIHTTHSRACRVQTALHSTKHQQHPRCEQRAPLRNCGTELRPREHRRRGHEQRVKCVCKPRL